METQNLSSVEDSSTHPKEAVDERSNAPNNNSGGGKKSRNKVLILVIIVSVIILLFAVSVLALNYIAINNTGSLTSINKIFKGRTAFFCKIAGSIDKKSSCITNIALNAQNFKICESLNRDKYSEVIEDCVREYVKTFDDLIPCQYFSPDANKINSCFKLTGGVEIEDCRKFSDITTADQCFLAVGLDKFDEEACNSIVDPDTADQCYLAVGLEKLDEDLCAKIKGASSSDECFFEIGLEKNDKDICLRVNNTEKKDKCLMNAASELNDIDICSLVTYEDSGESRKQCVLSIQRPGLNASRCSATQGTTGQDLCFKRLVFETKNYLYCLPSSSLETMNDCFTGYIGAEKNCSEFEIPEARDLCLAYSSQADRGIDGEKCSEIVNNDLTDSCYALAAKNSLNTKLCLKVEDSALLIECVAFIAKEKKDVSACNIVPEDISFNARLKCLNDYFDRPKIDEFVKCRDLQSEEISDPPLVDSCFLKLSGAKDDKGLCEYVESDYYHKLCLLQGATGEKCVDSDGGRDYFKRGVVTGGSYAALGYDHDPFTDGCPTEPYMVPDSLIEYFCVNDMVKIDNYVCENGCENGACKE